MRCSNTKHCALQEQEINSTCTQLSKFSLLESFFADSAPAPCVFILPNHWMFVRLSSNGLQSGSGFTDKVNTCVYTRVKMEIMQTAE